MDTNLFVNANGQQYAGNIRRSGKTFSKNVKYFVHVYSGFGIQSELVDRLIAEGYENITFVVKENLVNYRKFDKHGRNPVVCVAGKYKISIVDLMRLGTCTTLREQDGLQWFINKDYCAKL